MKMTLVSAVGWALLLAALAALIGITNAVRSEAPEPGDLGDWARVFVGVALDSGWLLLPGAVLILLGGFVGRRRGR